MDDYNANGSGPQTPDSDETIVYDFEPITSNRQRLILSQPRPVGHEMDQGGPTLPTTQHASLSAQRNMSEGELVARAMNGDGLNLQITEDASLGTQRGMLEYAAELAQGLIAFQQGGSSLLRTQDASLGAQQNIPGAETEPAQRSGDRATGRPAQELTMQEKADIMQDWKEADDEKKGLLQVCKQWYFRNADLTTGDVRTIVDEDEFPPNSYQFDIIVKHVKIWRAEFQRKIWGQPWFLQFVNDEVREYNASVEGHLSPYDNKSAQEKTSFWLHQSRWTKKNALKLYGHLRNAIDLEAALADDDWLHFMQGLYALACQSMWKNRCQWMNEKGEFPTEELKAKDNKRQVYEDIRATPDRWFPNRPSVNDVPAPLPDLLNGGRKKKRPQPTNIEWFAMLPLVHFPAETPEEDE